jgi:hypothetical protein
VLDLAASLTHLNAGGTTCRDLPTTASIGSWANLPRHLAAHLTGFEDLNSSANIDSSRKRAGQPMSWCNSIENLALLDNDNNGDSVPATVPA